MQSDLLEILPRRCPARRLAFTWRRGYERGVATGWIEKDRGRFRARARRDDGTKLSKTFDLRRDAVAWLDEVDLDDVPIDSTTTFREYVFEWWSQIVDLRPSSKASSRSYLATHVLPAFGDLRPAEITPAHLRSWIAELNAKGLAPGTVHKIFQTFRKPYVASAADGYAPRAEIVLKQVRLPKVERKDMLFLTPPEIGRLADAMDERYRALILTAAYGGLRLGELLALRVDNLDAARGGVMVERTLSDVGGHLYEGPPKTRASVRFVTLPGVALTPLVAHVADLDGDRIFPAPEGGPVRRSSWRVRFFKPAVRAASLNPGLRFHDLRHTAISLWIATGMDSKSIAQKAGHASVVTVLDRYGHVMPGRDGEFLDRLDQLSWSTDT